MRRFGFRGGGSASYVAQAVHFDGSNDYLSRAASFTGAADSKKWTFSAWVKASADTSNIMQILSSRNVASSQVRTSVFRLPSTSGFPFALDVTGHRPASSNEGLVLVSPSNSLAVAEGWVHALFSVDMADTAKRHLYLNDVSSLAAAVIYTNDNLDFTLPDWFVGAAAHTSGDKFFGDMADMWHAPGVYVDLSVEANRRKFISAAGKPVDLGGDGSLPGLGVPTLYLSRRVGGSVASFAANGGSGGGMTVNGTLTAASTSPSD